MSVIRYAPRLSIIVLPLLSLCAHAADRDVRVLNFDSASLDFEASQSTAALKSSAGAAALRFTAFGKQYTASLQPNSNISLPTATNAVAYKGTIDGRENSWLRVTKIGAAVHGLIFDGTDLFALEPATDIGGNESQGTAIFRLADTRTELGAEFCSALKTSGEQSGLALYKSLSGESKGILEQMQKAGARTRLQLSALMDMSFRNRYGSDAAANDAIVARVNNIDGIFSSQLGVEVELGSTVSPETPAAPIFNSVNPDTLLQTVARVRSETPALFAAGVTHLFTGTDLEGKTIGIAYMDAVCGQRYAASLSEARDRGTWFDSLVAAHELGHTFGSPHDGEGACAAEPATFLMAATISGTDKFSQCSLNKIQARIKTASCLIPIPQADISLPASVGTSHAAMNSELSWSLAIANIGNGDSVGSRVQITYPAALTVIDVHVDGDSCTVNGGVIACELGTVLAHVSRNVGVTFKGSQIGSHSIAATVSAQGDMDSANNSTTSSIRIDPSVDVSVALSGPNTAIVDQSFTATIAVSNKSSATVTNVSLDIVLPAGLTFNMTPQFGEFSCETQFQLLHCVATTFAAGRTASGSLALNAHEPGTHTVTATIDGNFSDPQPLDNAAQKSIAVTGPAPVAAASTAPAANESGGGAFGFTLLAALASAFGLRIRTRSTIVPA